MHTDVTVIIPTYNERENIIPLILEINNKFMPKKIIVVDDNSPDETWKIIEKNIPIIKNVFLIRNKKRFGLTKSLFIGLGNVKTPILVFMDGDFTHTPSTLNLMYKHISRYDAVIGSWNIKGGKDERIHPDEVLRSKIINKICNFLFSSKITAYTSGFIMSKSKIFNRYKLSGDYGEYFIDLCVYLARSNFEFTEVPYICRSRKFGMSKTNPDLQTFIIRGIKYLTKIISLFAFT
jgi:dolichol-phosphate mannosyltransferase